MTTEINFKVTWGDLWNLYAYLKLNRWETKSCDLTVKVIRDRLRCSRSSRGNWKCSTCCSPAWNKKKSSRKKVITMGEKTRIAWSPPYPRAFFPKSIAWPNFPKGTRKVWANNLNSPAIAQNRIKIDCFHYLFWKMILPEQKKKKGRKGAGMK